MKKIFSKLTKFLVKPLVLPVMLLFTSFGFGLRPVHAKSQMEQSLTVVGKQQPLSSTKALEALIKDKGENFSADPQRLSKNPMERNNLTPTKRGCLGTRKLMKLFATNPALKVLLVTGGFISVELLSMPKDITEKFKWTDLLLKPKGVLLRNKVKVFGSIVIIGLVCYTIREKQYLIAATKKIVELVQKLEFTSSAFERLKKTNEQLIGQMETKIGFLTKANQDLVSNGKSTLLALKGAYGSLVTSNSEIAELESLLYTAQTKFVECQTHLESALSIPESIRMDVLARFNDQQSQLIIRLQRQLTKALKKK